MRAQGARSVAHCALPPSTCVILAEIGPNGTRGCSRHRAGLIRGLPGEATLPLATPLVLSSASCPPWPGRIGIPATLTVTFAA